MWFIIVFDFFPSTLSLFTSLRSHHFYYSWHRDERAAIRVNVNVV